MVRDSETSKRNGADTYLVHVDTCHAKRYIFRTTHVKIDDICFIPLTPYVFVAHAGGSELLKPRPHGRYASGGVYTRGALLTTDVASARASHAQSHSPRTQTPRWRMCIAETRPSTALGVSAFEIGGVA